MTKREARIEARKVANQDGILMAITFNPYAEEEEEDQKYGFVPLKATKLLKHEEVVEVMEPR